MNSSELTQALRDATYESKKAERQHHKMEETLAQATEKHRAYSALKEKNDRLREGRRAKANVLFQAHPVVILNHEASLAHWEICRTTTPHLDWWGRKRSTPDEYYPVPKHPSASNPNSCPSCLMDIWKKCYDAVTD
jgi:hypothetical protein